MLGFVLFMLLPTSNCVNLLIPDQERVFVRGRSVPIASGSLMQLFLL